jgi:hypothetical protein
MLYLPRSVPQEVVVVESSRDGWTSRVSRRSALALLAALGLAGCTLSSQYTQDHDPYLQTMKKDPMVLWDPPMAATRTVYYSSQDDVNMEPGSSRTQINIRLTPVDLQVVPDLLLAAKEARTLAGYADTDERYGGRIDGQDFWIRCSVMATVSYHPDATPAYSAKNEVVVIDLDLERSP